MTVSSIHSGDSGPLVATVKAQLQRLGYQCDPASDLFDHQFESVIREFQQSRGIVVDGVVGGETFKELEIARYRLGDRVLRFDPVKPLQGDDVTELQHRLSRLGVYTGSITFEFDAATHNAVRELQTELGLSPDGIVGPSTLAALSAVYRNSSQGNLWALQERARVSASGESLNGRTIVIEAGTTARDFVHTFASPQDLEQEKLWSDDIASRVEGRLSALGASIVHIPSDKPYLADDLNAAAVVTVNQDHAPSPAPNGIATFYFGQHKDSNMVSPIGRSLGGLVHREVVARTPLLNCGVHARTWESLRNVNAPKVQVFAGYMSNPHDRELLAQAAVRDSIAEGISVAVQRLFLHKDNDYDTGTLNVESIREMRNLYSAK